MAFYFHILVANSFIFKYCVLSVYHHSGTYTRYMIPFYYRVLFLLLIELCSVMLMADWNTDNIENLQESYSNFTEKRLYSGKYSSFQ